MPELRKDPLIGRWVIISTERAKRPVDFVMSTPLPETQNTCPFCEGHEAETQPEIFAIRSTAAANGPGWSVRVIPNINPILRIEGELTRRAKGMFDVMQGIGAHELLIETPRHLGNLADLPVEQVQHVLQAAVHRIQDLERDPRFRYVLWFKNYGEIAGSSRFAHARSQLIATPVTPKRVKEELAVARRYFEDKERCLTCDVLSQEQQLKDRVVLDSSFVTVLCPFASRFPFELCILPKRHACDFASLQPDELADLAAAMQQVFSRLKRVLGDPSYNFVLHTAPFRRHRAKVGYWKTIEDDYHWHLECIPRLTRMAGFEWGSGFYINPTPPEEAAHYLREDV
jgi:UDPglucose--hexose-1-phosphate uridylyltransferase